MNRQRDREKLFRWEKPYAQSDGSETSPSVTRSKLVLLTAGQANKLRDELLGQGIVTLFRNQQTKKMVDWCPKEPSCSGLDASFFYRTKRRRWGGKAKKVISCCKYFLILARLQRGCVNLFFPAAIHRWAWSGCFLWTKQRYFSLTFRHGRQGSFLEMGHMYTLSSRQYPLMINL